MPYAEAGGAIAPSSCVPVCCVSANGETGVNCERPPPFGPSGPAENTARQGPSLQSSGVYAKILCQVVRLPGLDSMMRPSLVTTAWRGHASPLHRVYAPFATGQAAPAPLNPNPRGPALCANPMFLGKSWGPLQCLPMQYWWLAG